jgi:purine-nucleoside phosphorylase
MLDDNDIGAGDDSEKENIPEATPTGQETATAAEGQGRKTRAAKRSFSRPVTLRRKRLSTGSGEAGESEAATRPQVSVPREKEPAGDRRPRPSWKERGKRGGKKPGEGKESVYKERVYEERRPREGNRGGGRGGRPKSGQWDDDQYEIRSLPDGTQIKVKMGGGEAPAAANAPRRPRGGDSGPGPAVIDLDEYTSPFRAGERKINLGVIPAQNRRAVTFLKRNLEIKPKVAVILGSGLYPVAELAGGEPIPFSKIPGFTETAAKGHPGRLRSGMVEGTPVLFCEGRVHYYETMSMKDVIRPIRTFLALGVEYLILTTSAGGLNPAYRAGDVMFVSDHINLMGDNPFFGDNPNSDPSPFVDVSAVYDEKMIAQSERICRRIRINRREGVLAGMRGPVYETPAERSWLRALGADAVCMSVIPEALAAAGAGVPVTALALIANDVTSMKSRVLTHEAVAQAGVNFADEMKNLIKAILGVR